MRRCWPAEAASLAVGSLAAVPALAQAKNPFGVGISEGGGAPTGLMGWIMAQQGAFEHAIAGAIRTSAHGGSGLWLLMGLSFLYGVLHAAGPGHGKAVLAAYMVANERALRRGMALSFLAALLQAAVAIAVVCSLSYLFHATQAGMRATNAAIEKASYAGVAGLGLWLLWRKGAAFLAEWRGRRATGPAPRGLDYAFAGVPAELGPMRVGTFGAQRLAACTDPACRPATRGLACDTDPVSHEPGCGHYHAPDPASLGEGFSWREALSTVVAAGARPCSGAILVLVFAIAQSALPAGVAATLVMALGTALTTAALASVAVLAKPLALRLAGADSGNGPVMARGLEVLAAVLVLAVGLSLLLGLGPLQALA